MPWWLIIIIVIAVLALGLRILGECAFKAGFTWDRDIKKTEKINIDRIRNSAQADKEAQVLAARDWLQARESREVETESFDGLTLRARFYPSDRPKGPILLLAHGFRSYPAFDFSGGGKYYLELGCDLLMIDQRAHGASEGRYICFGVNEGRDVVAWSRWLDENYPGRPVVLGGISMGATSVLMAAGSPDLPANVRGVVADCGFTDCGGEFAHVLRQMHLPARLIMAVTQPLCRKRLGFGFWDYSTEEACRHMTIPALFIHGEVDALVPADNSRRAFAACASPEKELIIVPKADHGQSFLADEEGCRAKLKAFLTKAGLEA